MSEETNSYWKKCNTCKKPIGFNTTYQVCSVSSCNLKRNTFTFCSVPCWSAHVPVYRHRDAWALEKRSPNREEASQSLSTESAAMSSSNKDVSKEVLIVVSKLKDYIKQSADMSTSAEVIDVLSDKVRALCDQATVKARQEGRKTLMARDFFRSN